MIREKKRRRPAGRAIFLDRRALALRSACDVEDKRYCLSWIHVEPDGTAVATDGRAVVSIDPLAYDSKDWPAGLAGKPAKTSEAVDVPSKVAANVAKMIPSSSPREALKVAALTRVDENASTKTGAKTVEFTATDLRRVKREGFVEDEDKRPFPEHWREMLEHPVGLKPVIEIDMNAGALADTLDTIVKAAGSKGDPLRVTLTLFGPDKPIYFEASVSGQPERKVRAVHAPIRLRKE